ncbi:MAG: DUF4430 domain-containing protein [Clostridia bacterium]|nr:DUF4430 domain-containing protein [Clostridia bacterium]
MKTSAKLLSVLLVLCMLLSLAACGTDSQETKETPATAQGTETAAPTEIPAEGLWKDAKWRQSVTLGEGQKEVKLTVKAEDQSIVITVKTDEKLLGTALVALGIVEGEEGPYGLYIKKVNGILADYDVDQTYWGFYQNGNYMMTGVDTTEIAGGESFELVRTK